MKRLALAALSLLTALSFVTSAKAVTCLAVTDASHLLVFDSGSPGVVTDKGLVSGLAAGYQLVGLDIRKTVQTVGAANPGVGSVWALASNGTLFQLYVINPTTAAATAIGAPLAGLDTTALYEAYCFGFNPAKDRFQFISVQKNYEIDPNTATYVTETNFSGFPAQSGAAFSGASYGGTSTFYNVNRDLSPHILQFSSNVDSGVVSPVGAGNLGMNVGTPLGLNYDEGTFLIATEGVLSSVSATTGSATVIGNIMGNPNIRGLAIVPSSFPPALGVSVSIKGKKKITTSKAKLVIKGTATSAAGITSVQYKVGKAGFKTASGTTNWKFTAKLKPGTNSITVQATGGNQVVSAGQKIKVVRQ